VHLLLEYTNLEELRQACRIINVLFYNQGSQGYECWICHATCPSYIGQLGLIKTLFGTIEWGFGYMGFTTNE